MDPLKPDVHALYKSLRDGGMNDERARQQLQSYNIPIPSDLIERYEGTAPVASAATLEATPVPSDEAATPAPATVAQAMDGILVQNRLLAIAHLLSARFAQWASVSPDERRAAVRLVLDIERELLELR